MTGFQAPPIQPDRFRPEQISIFDPVASREAKEEAMERVALDARLQEQAYVPCEHRYPEGDE